MTNFSTLPQLNADPTMNVPTTKLASTRNVSTHALPASADEALNVLLSNIAPTASARPELKETRWSLASLDFASTTKIALITKLATG